MYSAFQSNAFQRNAFQINGLQAKQIVTGSGDDAWKRYLLWLERKKRKQFRRRAEYVKIPIKEATKIATIATEFIKRQDTELKIPYYNALEINDNIAKQVTYNTINKIYETFWKEKVNEEIKRLQDEEEEFFMVTL